MNKKAYTNPALLVVTMQQHQVLLAGSIKLNGNGDVEKINIGGINYNDEQGEIL